MGPDVKNLMPVGQFQIFSFKTRETWPAWRPLTLAIFSKISATVLAKPIDF